MQQEHKHNWLVLILKIAGREYKRARWVSVFARHTHASGNLAAPLSTIMGDSHYRFHKVYAALPCLPQPPSHISIQHLHPIARDEVKNQSKPKEYGNRWRNKM